MQNYYYYSPEELDKTGKQEPQQEKKPKKRHTLKRLTLFLLFLVIVIAAFGAAAYWYIQKAPIASTDGRTNIVILGVDEVAKLSDTIMLVSIDQTDPENPRAAMIGLPRDLYLPIPDYGHSKINAAYSLGENNDYRGGGAVLSVKTIEENFDIPIHYYAALDFEGFEKVIDTLGGIDVDVKTDIEDPFYPAPGYDGYEPLSISSGERTMDGELALKYARSRQTTNDFDRAFRQQQVVLAVQDKVLNTDLLFDIEGLNQLVDILDEHVSTDMTRLDMLKLAYLMRQLETDRIKQYVIDSSNLLVGTTNETGSALVPRAGDFSEIGQFVRDIFDQSAIEEFEPQQF